MKINNAKRAIELTKIEMNKAVVVGSEEYNTLQNARRDYQGYKVVVKSPSKKKTLNNIKGITVKLMREFVEKKGDDSLTNQFNSFFTNKLDMWGDKVVDDDGSEVMIYAKGISYGNLRSWFFDNFKVELKEDLKVAC